RARCRLRAGARDRRRAAAHARGAGAHHGLPAQERRTHRMNRTQGANPMSEKSTAWRHVTDLSGKTVVVTGCASGIGRATALQFASAGAIVYGGDRNDADGRATLASIRAAGGQGEFVMLDLTEGASIDAFVDKVMEA